jgi:hypothetical protein
LPGTYPISEEEIQTGGKTLHSEIHELIHSIWNKEEMPQKWKEPTIIVPGDKTDYSNYQICHSYKLQTKYHHSSLTGNSVCR